MRRLVILPTLLPLLLATAVLADTTAAPAVGIPQLHGHRFVTSPQVPLPFVRTTLRNTLGFGSTGNVETPSFIFEGERVPGLKGNVTAVALVFEYQVALKRWIALRGQFGLAGQFGTGVQTLLAEGLATTVEFEFGWLFHLRERERTALAGALNISNRSVTGINVFNLVSDIVEGTNYGLSHKTPVLNAEADLRWAWAVSELVGVSLVGTVGNGETLDRSRSSDWYYRGGLAVGFDLDKYRIPMSVALSGSMDNFGGARAAERASSWASGVMISYIGRDAFLLSLEFSRTHAPTPGLLEDLDINSMNLSLQYYF